MSYRKALRGRRKIWLVDKYDRCVEMNDNNEWNRFRKITSVSITYPRKLFSYVDTKPFYRRQQQLCMNASRKSTFGCRKYEWTKRTKNRFVESATDNGKKCFSIGSQTLVKFSSLRVLYSDAAIRFSTIHASPTHWCLSAKRSYISTYRCCLLRSGFFIS